MAVVLSYNLSSEQRVKLHLICTRLKLHERQVTPKQYGQPIGSLCGMLTSKEAVTQESFTDEMLVFCDFDNELLDRFLAEMRSSHMPPIRLKAVLTPTNMHWTSIQLCEELRREHDHMAAQRRSNRR